MPPPLLPRSRHRYCRRRRRSLRGRGAAPRFSADDLRRHLYAPEMHDPELLIRTSGEMRISNFLLWQCAYSELVFSDKLWPDFDEAALDEALAEYARRQRRFGGRARRRRRRAGTAPRRRRVPATPRRGERLVTTRIITGAVLAVLAVVLVVHGGLLFWLVMLALALLSLNEFYRLTKMYRPLPLAGFLAVALMLYMAWFRSPLGLVGRDRRRLPLDGAARARVGTQARGDRAHGRDDVRVPVHRPRLQRHRHAAAARHATA